MVLFLNTFPMQCSKEYWFSNFLSVTILIVNRVELANQLALLCC